jgi:hypothetical protein
VEFRDWGLNSQAAFSEVQLGCLKTVIARDIQFSRTASGFISTDVVKV